MWTISKCVVMIILSVLSLMDYKIRKVPRDVLVSCLAGAVIYRIVFVRIDWRLALAGALVGGIFVGISKLTREAIGYGDRFAIVILGIYLGLWGLLEVLASAFIVLGLAGLFTFVVQKKRGNWSLPFFPFLTAGYLLSVVIGRW